MKDEKKDIYYYDGMEVMCDGGDPDPAPNPQLSTEDLIQKTIAGVLDAQKPAEEPIAVAPELDPFDFSDMNVNNVDPNINNNPADNNPYDPPNNQNNQNNQQFDQYGNPVQANVTPQPIYDPRYDDMEARNIEDRKTTKMTGFMMELNGMIAELPELAVHKSAAIEEAKRSINSGNYIPANDLVTFLQGKDVVAKMRNVESNPNPNIGGGTDLNPSGEETPFDLEKATAEEIEEKYGHVQF